MKNNNDITPIVVNSILYYKTKYQQYQRRYPPKGIKRRVWNAK